MRAARVVALALALATPWAALGQQAPRLGGISSPVLTLDEARFFNQSLLGRRILADLDAAQAALVAENRRFEAELAEEERALTERRAGLPPAEFRALADAFDDKVESIRSAQEAKNRALLDRSNAERARFFPLARDVLAALMAETGAVVILSDEAIVLSFQQIDITDAAIARLDATVGTGQDAAAPGEGAAPEPPPAPSGDDATPPGGDGPAVAPAD